MESTVSSSSPSAPGRPRRRLSRGVGILLLLLAAWLGLRPRTPTSAASGWRPQPDRLPIGTVVRGSEVEFSAAILGPPRPVVAPAFIASLPSWLQGKALAGYYQFARFATKAFGRWRVDVTPPPGVEIVSTATELHSYHGSYFVLRGRLRTSETGEFNGAITLRPAGASAESTNSLSIGLQFRVVDPPAPAAAGSEVGRRILVSGTPYEEYATENGEHFEGLAHVNTALARRGIRVDYRRDLPSDLTPYALLLLHGTPLYALSGAERSRVQARVAAGMHLVLAADPFFVGTAPKANDLLAAAGIRIGPQDLPVSVTNAVVEPDPLTAGVEAVAFFRPGRMTVEEKSGAKLLLTSADGGEGFAAVSRATGRGDYRVLGSSLWWGIGSLSTNGPGNARLLELLLTP